MTECIQTEKQYSDKGRMKNGLIFYLARKSWEENDLITKERLTTCLILELVLLDDLEYLQESIRLFNRSPGSNKDFVC